MNTSGLPRAEPAEVEVEPVFAMRATAPERPKAADASSAAFRAQAASSSVDEAVVASGGGGDTTTPPLEARQGTRNTGSWDRTLTPAYTSEQQARLGVDWNGRPMAAAAPPPPPTDTAPTPAATNNEKVNEKADDNMVMGLQVKVEMERQMQRLAMAHFAFWHFWFLFIPGAALTMASGVLAFLSTSEAIEEGNRTLLVTVVGCQLGCRTYSLGNLALGCFLENMYDNQVAIVKAGGIPPLVALVRDGTDEQKKHATGAMGFLASDDDNNIAIAKAGGIPSLVTLVRDGTDEQKKRRHPRAAAAASRRE